MFGNRKSKPGEKAVLGRKAESKWHGKSVSMFVETEEKRKTR